MAFGCFRNLGCFPIFYILLAISLLGGAATARLALIGSNVSLSFDDIEANFAPSIKGSAERGILHLAEPLDACSPLLNKVTPGEGASSPFVLIIRGVCSFEDKVRSGQNAGFKAAIIFDDEDKGSLVAMAGNPVGIKIPAVFVSKTSGEMLKKYAGLTDIELWILPQVENSAWSIMAIAFISLLAMSAVLATCFFVRRHRIRREQPQAPHVQEFHGMSGRLVKAMPSLIFTTVLEDNCTSITCAICLEDYGVGEKLRILPCHHKFHAVCVDSWLTTWRTFCPICKRDARTTSGDPPASESTPLLSPSSTRSSALSSVHSSFTASSAIQIASSFRSSTALSAPCSSRATSSAIQIASASFRSPSASHTHSLSSTPYTLQLLKTYRYSPSASASSNYVDLRNAAPSNRFRASHLGSPSTSHTQSLSSSPYMPQSLKIYGYSPTMSVSRSSVDIRNAASSHRFHASHLVSPHSLGLSSLASPLNSQYASPFIPSSSNGSPNYIRSSSRQPFLQHRSDSATSISPLASAQSLPGC